MRSEKQERRRLPRVHDSFPVAVSASGSFRRGRALKGVARDYNEEAVCVRVPAAALEGSKVRLSFNLPQSLSSNFRGLHCEWSGKVANVRPDLKQSDECDLIVELDGKIGQLTADVVGAHQRKFGLLVLLVLVSMLWLKWDNIRFFWYSPLFYLYSFTIAMYFISRFFISRFYRPPDIPTEFEPTISIVISVRNEEDAITKTVESCFGADYPDDKREVIVVNDGSTDSTPQVLEKLQKKYPRLIVRSIPPSGKRDGMATGVRLAKGELIVFVDSDTFLYPDSLRHIVCGFEDPTLGASSGHTEVANASRNVLTGLQEVRYFLSYRLMKASESVFSAVSCCPGCLSAYRREYVLEVLDPWLHQRFLGAKATFGDDRSLTNYILRKHRVIYNERALSSTLAPETWGRYMRQQVRWKKSWLRETLLASSFMWRKHPLAAISFYVGALCSLLSPIMVFRAGVLSFVEPDSILLYYVVGLLLVGIAQCLFFYLVRPSRTWLLGMLLVAVQVVLMGPQTYYAMFTMRKNHWGTRG